MVGTSWVCPTCRRGLKLAMPVRDWPEWAKFLRTQEEKRRERAAALRQDDLSIDEIQTSDLPGLDRLFYGDGDDGQGDAPPLPNVVRVFM